MRKYTRRNANYKILMIVLTILITVFGIAYSPRHASSDETNISNMSQTIDGLTQQIQKLTADNARISTDAETGMVRFIGTDPLNAISIPAALGSKFTSEQAARSFLSGYGRLFGISDQANELEVMESNTVDNSRSFIHFQQVYEDIPILGGELIVQADSNNNVISASSDFLPKISLDVTPTISPSVAQATALGVVAKAYGLNIQSITASEPQLWIYNPTILGIDQNITSLVWRMEVMSVDGEPIRELVLVDAQLGFVALHFNQIETVIHRDVYTAKNGSVCTAAIQALLRNEGDPLTGNLDVDNAYNYSGYTYDFYSIEHGRNSINNAGMTIISVVDYDPDGGCNYRNAFWNGLLMVFGTGYTSACDVVAHELTHGVTDYESNLFYYMQSGAISEAFSDIWGEFVELTYNPGELSDRWLIGEDLPTGALRDMQEPPDSLDYTQPDKMTSTLYACGDFWREYDNGGVHINNGIANKAAYLMVDGDTFNGYVVTGMGMSKTADLFYEVQTNLLTSGSDYADLYDALQQAAINLGYNASERQTVKDAIDATEMNLQPTSCPASEAPLLDSGVPYDLFFDDLESGSGNWSPGSLEGTGAWVYATGYAASGLYCLYGQDYDAINNFYIAMTSNVTLPVGSQSYLHFKHSFDFEFDSDGTWDGGVVEYSTDGGGAWNDAGSLFTHNGYTGNISAGANPLAGRDAFVGYSNGYISSRLNLSSLAGQNIRFRFRIGTDDGNLPPDYSIGWCIDDIRIYTPASQTTVNISPYSQTVGSNQSFTVGVYVAPGEPIAGTQLNMSFNATLLQANSVTQGNLLNQGGCSTMFNDGTIDNTAGTITGVVGSITTLGCNISNPGTFANISFTARNVSGTSFLNMSTVEVDDPGGSAVAISLSNGSVSIAQRWDVNCDGKVNIGDMVRIGQHWGQTGAPGWIPEDVNQNGVINVGDMTLIGQHWTG